MAYRASKAAMNMVAACYAKEQARFGVKVLAVHPGTEHYDFNYEYSVLCAIMFFLCRYVSNACNLCWINTFSFLLKL